MDLLSSDIHVTISEFLNKTDVIHFASTCKTIKNNLGLVTFYDSFSYNFEKSYRWNGSYNNGDREMYWFHLTPNILKSKKIHTIRFRCAWKDQGWGNRKGRLIIREDSAKNQYTNNNGQANLVGHKIFETNIAEHQYTSLKIHFQPEPGKTYTMSYVVGGGGGHELCIKNPKVSMLIYNGQRLDDVSSILIHHPSLSPLLSSRFGIKTMVGAIDILIQKQDAYFLSIFLDIGVDATDLDLLKSMKDFLILLDIFRQENIPNVLPNISPDDDIDSYAFSDY